MGYGKTEVALRAVMKCILDGKQAAILVPTTVLAQQHYQTAVQRFFGYPVDIQVMSRFRSPAQMRSTLADLKSGKCDLVIGTHRLLQKDVEFKRPGPAHRGRGAALRRFAQGTYQGTQLVRWTC